MSVGRESPILLRSGDEFGRKRALRVLQQGQPINDCLMDGDPGARLGIAVGSAGIKRVHWDEKGGERGGRKLARLED